jgi:hypothetical protein
VRLLPVLRREPQLAPKSVELPSENGGLGARVPKNAPAPRVPLARLRPSHAADGVRTHRLPLSSGARSTTLRCVFQKPAPESASETRSRHLQRALPFAPRRLRRPRPPEKLRAIGTHHTPNVFLYSTTHSGGSRFIPPIGNHHATSLPQISQWRMSQSLNDVGRP